MSRPKRSQIKTNDVKEETQPTPVPIPVPIEKVEVVSRQPVQRQPPPKTVVREVVKTYEDMRKERLSERLKKCRT